jgi:subtilisin family serine protease
MVHLRARARVTGLTAALVAIATVSTTVFATGSAGAAPGGASSARARPATTVTLITGDVVTLGGSRGVEVTAARGREHIGFQTRTDMRGHVHVIPTDALTAVSSGRVDPRLFDVSELASDGYADREDLPLIVDYRGATPRIAGARTVRELPSMSATALRVEKDTRFWEGARSSANKIWLDGRVEATLEHSVPQIGAPRAWAAGHTGKGSTVAVLDTGIDVTHPDLDDAVVDARDFSDSESGTDDRFGHGTHVASIVTGAGERYKGVAPDAKLLNGKVLDDFGGGWESGIIAGMEWAATGGADVINMSLGGWPTDGTDPMSQAVNTLTAETGALFVIAAGNSGPGDESVSTPGTADAALTVGAVDRDDELAEFSSRGPRWLDGAIKPDITAPGVDIVAAKAADGVIGDPVEDGYVSLSGTSMATPHVAGAAAILAGQHPGWTADQLKPTLMASAAPNAGLSVFEQGAGRVDVAAAVSHPAFSTPASLSVGTVQWPHDDDQPIVKTLTYHNSGAEPITFDLAVDVRGPDGKAAPAGMFALSASEVTVPAGGSAEVTLTTDTKAEAPDGVYSGVVLAGSGDTTVRTPVAVTREVESYDVRLTFLDRDGSPTPDYNFRFVDRVTPKAYLPYDESGTVVARLPKGRYYFEGTVQEPSEDGPGALTSFTEPDIVVTGPGEYVFDAREGKQPGIVVDEPDAKAGLGVLGFNMTTEWGETGSTWIMGGFDGFLTRPSRTTASGAFVFGVEAQLAKPDGAGEGPGFHASPYLYNVRKSVDGVVPAEPTFRVTNRELAKVRSTYAVATPGRIGIREGFLTMPLPYSLTEYYTPNEDWYPHFYEATSWDEFPPDGMFSSDVAPVSYRRGTVSTQRWNAGVFGPSFALSPFGPGEDFARYGDDLLLNAYLHTDQNSRRGGFHFAAEGTTELLRGGEVIAKSEYPGYVEAALPPEEVTYTARTTATLAGRLSTRIDAEWTFTSGHADGELPALVPALAVRFAPNLDDHNAAPAGRRFRVPVYVQRNGSQTPGRVGAPAIEVSYDDGATWRKANVTRNGGGWTAEVTHPRGAEFVSLRSSVSDRDGNVAKQTIIRAYALKK